MAGLVVSILGLFVAIWQLRAPERSRILWVGFAVVVLAGIAGFGYLVADDGDGEDRASSCRHPPIRTAAIEGTASFSNLTDNAAITDGLLNPLEGSTGGVADEIDVWVFTSPAGSDRFYMQSHRGTDPADRVDGDRFVSSVFVSGTADVALVLATPAASASLSATLGAWEEAGDFPGLGLDELPAGLKETDCVGGVHPV